MKNQKRYKLAAVMRLLSMCLFCSCQRQELKDAGLDEEKIVRDKNGNYFRLKPHVGDTFFIEPLDMGEYEKF